MSPPVPNPPQQTLNHLINNNNINSNPITNFPDLFLTAVSIFLLFSSSCPSSSSKSHFPKIPFLSFNSNPRRFLKTPSMSISNSYPLRHRFATPQSLSEWLKPRLPSDSFASWGVKPGTKNVHNLWLELSEGETSLADSTPPMRNVNVVTVRILRDDDRILVESHQELSDGSVRARWRPLSEKLKPNETHEEAVFRAIREELGSIVKAVRIVPGSYKEKVEERNSVSYPGLPARYVLHSVDVVVEGLPDGDFSTEEGEEYEDSEEKRTAQQAVSVKRHFWKWVSPDSVQS